jgi:N-acetylmuramic acid 6-phosphate (MurNAc-6-P) etherase
MRRWGRKPSRRACRDTENAHEMTACEAMTVATVASTTIGRRAQCGISRKKGLVRLAGSRRMRAACAR